MATTGQHEVEAAANKRTLSVAEEEDEDEEVTETRIIGVTDKGVIRKRSIKRKITKEEKSMRGYGTDKAEYAKIVERLLAERIFSGTIEGLRERWQMLEYMHTDCMDMVDQWMKRREERMLERKSRNADSVIALFIVVFLLFGTFWLIKTFVFS